MPKRIKKNDGRKVLYAKPVVKQFTLSATRAMELLGWEEEPEDGKWGADYLLRDEHGKKIRLSNNIGNRIYSPARTATYKQDILRKRWEFNMHTRIIGKTGIVLSGQHVLPALVLAVQCWELERDKWHEWSEEPTIDTLIAYGCEETDAVKNTIDTARESSLTDVLYRSKHFEKLKTGERKRMARMLDYAVHLVWYRTGGKLDAYAPKLTHTESLDFIEHHPGLLECVRHIYEEDKENKNLGSFLSPGTACGFLYLMAASDSDIDEYRQERNENAIDWEQREKACNFFTLLIGKAEELKLLREALGRMLDDGPVSNAERFALLIKAWGCYRNEKPITATTLKLDYIVEHEIRTLKECLTVGGIDLGDPKEEDEEHIPADDPTPEEIVKQKETIREERAAKKEKEPIPKKKKEKPFIGGDNVWVVGLVKGNHWQGIVVDVLGKNAKVKVAQGFAGTDTIQTVALDLLRREQPENGYDGPTCPNCKGVEFDEDGDCSSCHEPSVA